MKLFNSSIGQIATHDNLTINAANRCFSMSFFDVCPLNEIGYWPNSDSERIVHDFIRAYHCVAFENMTVDCKVLLWTSVRLCLRLTVDEFQYPLTLQSVNTQEVVEALAAVRSIPEGFLQLLR